MRERVPAIAISKVMYVNINEQVVDTGLEKKGNKYFPKWKYPRGTQVFAKVHAEFSSQ